MNRILIFLFGLTGFAFAEAVRSDGTSSSKKIDWHVVEKPNADDGAEVLISEGGQGESAASKLCDVPWVGNTKVFVSADDFWIIVESGGASLGVSLKVYQRQKGLLYQELPKRDIALAVLTKTFDGNADLAANMDHVYAHLIGWSEDSKSILAKVSGDRRGQSFGPIFAIYDLGAGSIGFDLTKFNSKLSGH